MPFKPFPGQLNKDGVIIIPKGYVKLPEPAVSDYIIPTGASASSDAAASGSINPYSFSVSSSSGQSTDKSATSDYITFEISPQQTVANGVYVEIAATVDTSPINTLSFSYYAQGSDSNGNTVTSGISLEVYLDTTLVASFNGTSLLTSASVDLSSYEGYHTLRFRVVNGTGSTLGSTSTYVPPLSGEIYKPNFSGYWIAFEAIDGHTTNSWKPSSANAGEWIQIDAGSNSIIGGARIYWGSNVPNKYRIQASTDGSTWVDVYTATSSPTANDWTEYSWPAVYARYLRLYLDDQGSNPVEVAEFQYYSRITDRVAAEHGHGSGPEPWREGAFFSSFMRAISKGTGITPRIAAVRGSHRKKRLNQKINDKKKKSRLTKKDILELIEELREYIDFKVPD